MFRKRRTWADPKQIIDIDYEKITASIITATKQTSRPYLSVLINVGVALLSALLASLLAAYIINTASDAREKSNSKQEAIVCIQNMYIGCNKNWVDENLGMATFVKEVDLSRQFQYVDYVVPDDFQLTECVYVLDFSIVHVFYDSAMSNRAFFITILSNEVADYIRYPSGYDSLVDSENVMGSISYYDIEGSPSLVGGFLTNGNSRVAYFEDYYYNSAGNYCEFIFATLDYGYIDSWDKILSSLADGLNNEESRVDREVRNISDEYSTVLKDRKNHYPNTFGISSYPSEITQHLVLSYNNFDSMQLRNKQNGDPSVCTD